MACFEIENWIITVFIVKPLPELMMAYVNLTILVTNFGEIWAKNNNFCTKKIVANIVCKLRWVMANSQMERECVIDQWLLSIVYSWTHYNSSLGAHNANLVDKKVMI